MSTDRNFVSKNKNKAPERIETPRLVLRKAAPSDLYAIWNNIWRQESIARTMFWQTTSTEEEARERLERTIRYQSLHPAYFVCLKETDEAIGFAGIREREPEISTMTVDRDASKTPGTPEFSKISVDPEGSKMSENLEASKTSVDPEASKMLGEPGEPEQSGAYEESGICVAQRYQGQGFGKEILAALLELVFGTLGGNCFYYACMRENERSRSVCRHFGFQFCETREEIRQWDRKKFTVDIYRLKKT